MVVYSSPTMTVQNPAFQRAVTDTVVALPKDDVVGAATYYTTGSPTLVSGDKHATRVLITLAGASRDDKSDHWEAVKDDLESPGLRTTVGGQWAVFGDVNEQVSKDIARAESLSMPIVFILC